MDGTVNDASLEVLAFDCAGAAGNNSLVSRGTIFDAMTMGCFKFNSSLGGLDTALAFSNVFAGVTALTGFIGFIFLTGRARLAAFVAGLATGLTIFFATVFGAGFATDLTTGFLAGLAIVLTTALIVGLAAGFTGLTVFFAATLVTTLAAALIGVFLTAFFATVFIHCLPAELVFIQIKQSTHTHQRTNAFTLKLPGIYLHLTVASKYSNIAKIRSARGL